ncbi:hypothetical protein [Janthinobacterium sp. B9-8]|uniref:hypothetical protein n=1 Tax=Janthinobacterium sp. B9-8 TaxID=1236179 RepID=UPI00061D162C|nr:hypothetical protein [Janthinobacterium sp. B9-8]AMC34050.1 hypothetical protein VN23_05300 [Janthinobacterium sp. B9-8]
MKNEESLFFKLSVATLASCKTLIWPTPFLFLISYWLAASHMLDKVEIGLLMASSLATAIQYYFYWRITLDEKLLNQLQSETDFLQLDQVLNSLFDRNTPPRALALRMLGIKKLIRHFLISTFCSWLGWFILLGLLIS